MSPQTLAMLAPMVLLFAASLGLPALFVPRRTLSQARLALGIGLAALVMLGLGAAVFAGLYALSGARIFAALAEEPAGVVGHLLGVSLRAVPFWAPVLALVWLIRAQAVERRKGEAVADQTRAVAQPNRDE